MDCKLVFLVLAVVSACAADGHEGENSCATRCFKEEKDANFPCQCNRMCVENGDCCEDFGKLCLVDHWNKHAHMELEMALRSQDTNKNLAKNVIVFLGDGMDLSTNTAARILKGQQRGNYGEEEVLTFEMFPHVGFSKTYVTDKQVADSGAAATALFSGVKTKTGTLGCDDRIQYGVCESTQEALIDSTLVSAKEAGKSTGIVTTSRITHATPAALYAHSANRDWEHDAEGDCTDIASQLLMKSDHLNVLLGGGRREFTPNTTADHEYEDMFGRRTDGRNLLVEWDTMHEGDHHQFVWNKAALDAVDYETTEYLMGLFEPSHMQYEYARDEEKEPSIAEMTVKALEILKKNNNGFFLMVEGARIDHAHHQGQGHAALVETIAFDNAVNAALDIVNTRETLIIVTSDHAHGLHMSGYAERGNSILGLTTDESASDGLPTSTLSYTGGKGSREDLETFLRTGMRRNLTEVDLDDPNFRQPALFPTREVNHAGQDVPIYAIGPMAHMFHSTHEQNYVAHVMRHAACIGKYTDNCSRIPYRKDKQRKQPMGM